MQRINQDIIHSAVNQQGFYPFPPADVDPEETLTNPEYFISLVSARFYQNMDRPGRELENKAVIGIILSITTPSSVGPVGSLNSAARPGNAAASAPAAKRQKPMLGKGERILICGDITNSSTFSVVVIDKIYYFNILGQQTIASDIILGDCVMFFEPMTSPRTLGNGAMPILEQPRAMVILKTNLNLPPKPIIMSSNTSTQIHFHQAGCTVDVAMVQLLMGPEVPCVGPICDRQNKKCNGCPGHSKNKSNYVLFMLVEIANQVEYNATTRTAAFPMRSYKTTCLFIKDPDSFSAIQLMLMKNHQRGIRQTAKRIVACVNANGGWTVSGWHRRGLLLGEDGAVEYSDHTKGHLVRLEPTNQSDDITSTIAGMKYVH